MRRVFQVLLLLIIIYAIFTGGDIEKYCPAGGMSSVAGQIVNGRMSCQMSAVNIFMFFGVVGSMLLAGRLFCSFLCPLGTVSEALAVVGKKIGMAKNITGVLDKALRLIKYILLFWVLKETFNTSELFCKTFDPYFAIAGGFKHEVIPWAALLTIGTLVGGAIAGKLFWCKYVCFFGAAQNVFSTIFGAVAGGIYIGSVSLVGGSVNFPVLFFIICLIGWLAEVFAGQAWLPLVKVSRNSDSCTSCKLCDKVCPYGIEVSASDKVTHPDCHLCGECVDKCPVNDTLTYKPFGGSWLAPALTVILILVALTGAGYFGTDSSFATVRFVPPGLVVDGKTVCLYERDNVPNIHCFGSSMSFIQRLGKGKNKDGTIKWKKGVLGAETYSSTKTFKVFYNPALTSEAGIDSMIFRSGKLCASGVCAIDSSKVPVISVWKIGVWELLDDWSIATLRKKIAASSNIYAFESHFGEPVVADIYYNSSAITKEQIKEFIEDPKPVKFGKDKIVNYKFRVNHDFSLANSKSTGVKFIDGNGSLNVGVFKTRFFPYYKKAVDKVMLKEIKNILESSASSDSAASSESSETSIALKAKGKESPVTYFEVALSGLDDPLIGWSIYKIVGQLKTIDGLLEVRTGLNDKFESALKVMTIKGTVTKEILKEKLSAPFFKFIRSGKMKEYKNEYKVTGNVEIIDSTSYQKKGEGVW